MIRSPLTPMLKVLTTLVTAAWAAVRVKTSYLRAQFLRIKARRGAKKAILAVAAEEGEANIRTVKDNAEAIFTWDYEKGRRPALNKLYEKAKHSQWNGETDLDWSIEVDQEAVAIANAAANLHNAKKAGSGVVNIGLEGMMILGTFGAGWAGYQWGPWVGLVVAPTDSANQRLRLDRLPDNVMQKINARSNEQKQAEKKDLALPGTASAWELMLGFGLTLMLFGAALLRFGRAAASPRGHADEASVGPARTTSPREQAR